MACQSWMNARLRIVGKMYACSLSEREEPSSTAREAIKKNIKQWGRLVDPVAQA